MFWRFFTCNILTVISFKKVSIILECQFIFIFRNDYSCSTFVFLVSDRVMKPLKNAFRIIFPHFSWNERVLWIYFKTIVSYSIQKLTRGSYERNGIYVTESLSILETFPYYLRNVIEFMSFFFFANKQQSGIGYISVNCQTSFVKKHFVTPRIAFFCKLWKTLFITFASELDGIRIKIIYRSIFYNFCSPIVCNILFVKYSIKTRICNFYQRIIQSLPCFAMSVYRTTLHMFGYMDYPNRFVRVICYKLFNQQTF